MSTPRFPNPSTPIRTEGPLRVLLLENIHVSAERLLAAEGFEVERVAGALKPDELAEKLKGVHLLGIRSKTNVPESSLVHAENLLAVGGFCIGTNQVDLKACQRPRRPRVQRAVQQHAQRGGDGDRGDHRAGAPAGRSLARGAHGPVAQGGHRQPRGARQDAGHRRLRAHRLAARRAGRGARHARGLLRHHDQAAAGQQRARRATLDELLAESDFVTLHVPATPQTNKMIGAAELAQMKKGAYLLNASRGTVVDIPALARCAAAPGTWAARRSTCTRRSRRPTATASSRELQNLPNVVLTPHIGGSTEEAQEAIGREVATSLIKFVQHRRDHGRGELPAGRGARASPAPTASSTCTATCRACCATSTASSPT